VFYITYRRVDRFGVLGSAFSIHLEAKMNTSLSSRELEVLKLVAIGRTNRQVGDELAISVRTVEGHRGRAMMKIGATNMSDLIRYAVRIGLIEP